MGYYCIDIPSAIEESAYHRILGNVLSKLAVVDGVEAIYQIGGISSPGISDLDLVLVFRNNFRCDFNIHQYLSDEEKYLFIHKLYGCSAKYFHESSRFSFFHNFTLLFGNDIKREEKGSEVELSSIRTQIALEYMVKMYTNIMLQKEYGILQVRSLLLHGKALNFDLDFLGVDAVEMKKTVSQLLELRKNWFNSGDSVNKIREWFIEFIRIFPDVLDSILKVRGLYMPEGYSDKIARNIALLHSDSLSCLRHGILLPAFPASLLGKKYFRLQNRFNKFEIHVPFRTDTISPALQNYFNFQHKQKDYNRTYLPHFYPLASSLLA